MARNPRRTKNQLIDQPQLPVEQLPETIERSDSRDYFFLTNRNNLQDILSSGWIRPAREIKKYYDDLGKYCPDSIPLLTVVPTAKLIGALLPADDPNNFPVLLDLDLQGMSGEAQVILDTYKIEHGRLPLEKDTIGMIIKGVIPASCIKNIYFRSKEEREEQESVVYGNLRSDNYPLRISSSVFRGTKRIDIDRFLEALGLAEQQLPNPDINLFPGTQALGGALIVLGDLATRDPRQSLQVLQSVLVTLLKHTPALKAMPDKSNIQPNLAEYLNFLPVLLLSGLETSLTDPAEADRLPSGIMRYIEQSNFPTELLFFGLTVNILMTTDSQNYFNEETLGRIRDTWEHLHSEDISEAEREKYLKLMSSIRAVLRSNMDLAAFPAEDSLVGTALLYFLMRSRPEQALSWLEAKLPLGSDVLALTVVLAGVLYGRSLVPISSRESRAFEKYIDEILAWKLNFIYDGVRTSIPFAETNFETRGDIELLKSSEQVLIQHRVQAGVTGTFEELYTRSRATVALEYISEERPPDLSEDDILTRLREDDLREGPAKRAALYLCEVANWEECVTAIISLEERKYTLYHHPQREKLVIAGFPKTDFTINVAEFRQRLIDETWHKLPDRVKERVKRKLEGNV